MADNDGHEKTRSSSPDSSTLQTITQGDTDAEVEAAAVAQSLRAQLWADIRKAKAQEPQSRSTSSVPLDAQISSPHTSHTTSPGLNASTEDPGSSRPENPPSTGQLVQAIQLILKLSQENQAMRSRLEETKVVQAEQKPLLEVLNDCVATGTVDSGLLNVLGELLGGLAVVSKGLIRKRKRKRRSSHASQEQNKRSTPPGQKAQGSHTQTPDNQALQSPNPLATEGTPALTSTTPWTPHTSLATSMDQPLPPITSDLNSQIGHAIAIIHATLTHSLVQGIPLDANIVASIQAPLHHIFLFAATSAVAGGSQNVSLLQEISGLIQVLGVLHGVTIAPSAVYTPFAQTHPNPNIPANQVEAVQSHFVDIGTAVYPCLFPACGKTFSRLFHLRAHQGAHSFGKPYQCLHCTASFSRKHDLKRHDKSHNTTVFKCGGCFRTFTRRDALKRHKMNKKSAPACASSPFEETTADVADLQSSSRRVRANTPAPGPPVDAVEEGELKKDMIIQAQQSVTILHPLLQGHVMHALSAQSARQSMANTSAIIPIPPAVLSHPPLVPPSSNEAVLPALLSGYNLNEEQTTLLEKAIASAHEAARAQAELEAQLELGEDWDAPEEEDEDDAPDTPQGSPQVETGEAGDHSVVASMTS